VRHYDLYRIENASEMDELGLDDALAEGAALIEWPERAEGRLPSDMLHVALSVEQDVRNAQLTGPAKWARYFEGAHVA
jgi:hypothetical protein